MKKKLLAAVCAGLMALGTGSGVASAVSLPAGSSAGSSAVTGAGGMNAPAGTVVKQGDRITVHRGVAIGNCTLGYVDRRAGVGYTAAHCGFAGEPVFNAHMQVIGFFEQSNIVGNALAKPLTNAAYLLGDGDAIDRSTVPGLQDIARIRLIPGVVAGANGFSGDRIVPLNEIRRGDRICAVGSRSQRVTCGRVANVAGSNTYGVMPGLIRGDSGGPGWIPGKGYVGSLSGWTNYTGGRWGNFEQFVHPSAR